MAGTEYWRKEEGMEMEREICCTKRICICILGLDLTCTGVCVG